MLIKSTADLDNFKTMYGIDEEIAKVNLTLSIQNLLILHE